MGGGGWRVEGGTQASLPSLCGEQLLGTFCVPGAVDVAVGGLWGRGGCMWTEVTDGSTRTQVQIPSSLQRPGSRTGGSRLTPLLWVTSDLHMSLGIWGSQLSPLLTSCLLHSRQDEGKLGSDYGWSTSICCVSTVYPEPAAEQRELWKTTGGVR